MQSHPIGKAGLAPKMLPRTEGQIPPIPGVPQSLTPPSTPSRARQRFSALAHSDRLGQAGYEVGNFKGGSWVLPGRRRAPMGSARLPASGPADKESLCVRRGVGGALSGLRKNGGPSPNPMGVGPPPPLPGITGGWPDKAPLRALAQPCLAGKSFLRSNLPSSSYSLDSVINQKRGKARMSTHTRDSRLMGQGTEVETTRGTLRSPLECVVRALALASTSALCGSHGDWVRGPGFQLARPSLGCYKPFKEPMVQGLSLPAFSIK